MGDINKHLTIRLGSKGLGCLVVVGAIAISSLCAITAGNIARGYLGRTRVDLMSESDRKANFIAGDFHNPRSLIIKDRDRIDQLDLHLDYLGDRRDVLNRHYDFFFEDPKKEVDINLKGLTPGRYTLQVFIRDMKGNESYREFLLSEDQTI